ncbi:hypothetical protein SEA_SPIKELEE_53 [Mycobacterium phage Spikelee]|uniref:Uncharacterized protein n=4 Tax=Cheoctovirus TaxID=1623281 RepID=B5U5J5_9CAUD|nr:gp48 [Mycobacterium phage Ramsey]YP_009200670.1 hypothetical protein AVT13_gp043 [Mycobacterium phage Bipolar]YP_009962506.1 hypothetical protein I5H90_gp053 [Mycobacterium phage Spikelee]QIQ63730.1 hypothetical protein SEA_PHANPHAGIA_41 [Mycobacterium phage Phanphagia]ACI12660.1 hypothetical protein RAMSEY_48 [Mycobacterium phage Ramsey]AIT13081.1 hypothetical protein PBI_BIPOLAR_43 [Mycobacterium phage Bipolar]AXQ62182.1 hypothetical protein SEA_SPIKELEE_53 [Mycobacterium phage Spikelee]
MQQVRAETPEKKAQMSTNHFTADGVEVITSDTHRRRDRNAIRAIGGVDVLPPDVQTKVSALQNLDGAAQAAAITAILSHSRTGLLAAIAAHDLPQIVEWKKKASAIETIAKQVRMGKEFQLDAAEFVRRAERGLGVAIREGQERGEIGSKTNGLNNTGPRQSYERNGKVVNIDDSQDQNFVSAPSPRDFASRAELFGSRGDEGIYAMTDGVSDEQFEEAITEAREEGNLSRANVARKAKAKAQPKKEAIDANDPLIDAEVAPAQKKTARARRTIEMLSVTTANLALSVADIDPGEVDKEQLAEEITIIFDSLGTIRSFLRKVNQQ